MVKECSVVVVFSCFLTVNYDVLCPSCFSPKASTSSLKMTNTALGENTVCIVTFSVGLSALYSL